MKIKIKKLDQDAKIPEYAHPGDAGFDLFSVKNLIIPAGGREKVATGLIMEIPDGYVGLIWDKSGLSANHGLKTIAGVVDSGYRGEVLVAIWNTSDKDYEFKKGDKVAQMLIQPVIFPEIEEIDNLSETSRGDGGFGSTGK